MPRLTYPRPRAAPRWLAPLALALAACRDVPVGPAPRDGASHVDACTRSSCTTATGRLPNATALEVVSPTRKLLLKFGGDGGGQVAFSTPPVSLADTRFFPAGAAVTLTAAPAAYRNSVFAGWDGACAAAGGSPTCTLTMDQDRTVSVYFYSTVERHVLTVAILGNSAGSRLLLDPPAVTALPGGVRWLFPYRTTVTITASPSLGFRGWGGACAAYGTAPSCKTPMSQDRDVTATF